MRKSMLFVAAALALAASTARAQSQHGAPYVGAHLGLAMFHDSDIKPSGIQTLKAVWKSGLGFGFDVGYRMNENIRLEGEFSYKKNDIDTINGVSAASGDLMTLGFMANAYYDITQVKLPVTPFIGVGLGALYGKVSSPSAANGGLGDVKDTEFGYQVTAGLGYAINPQATVHAFYRYQGSSDLSFTIPADQANGVPATKVKVTYGSSTIAVGLNYSF